MGSSTHSDVVKIGKVFHHKNFNKARLSGETNPAKERELHQSMVADGWKMNGDGTLEVVKIDEFWKDFATKFLTEKWAKLKEAVKTNSKLQSELHVFEQTRTAKGKIIVPELMGVSGNTRDRMLTEGILGEKPLPGVNVARYDAGLPLITEYPVIVAEFDNMLELVINQVLENSGKLTGFSKMTEKDFLLAAKIIYDESKKVRKGSLKGVQNDIRRAVGDTSGQKLFGIMVLDERFPDVKLLHRLTNLKTEEAGFLRYGPISGPAMPNLVMRSDPQALADENVRRRTKGLEQYSALTQEGLEDFLGTKKTNAHKIMSKDNIVEMKDTKYQNEIIKATAAAVYDNNTDPLKKYEVQSALINNTISLCTLGFGPDLEEILANVSKAQDPKVAIASLKKAVKA